MWLRRSPASIRFCQKQGTSSTPETSATLIQKFRRRSAAVASRSRADAGFCHAASALFCTAVAFNEKPNSHAQVKGKCPRILPPRPGSAIKGALHPEQHGRRTSPEQFISLSCSDPCPSH